MTDNRTTELQSLSKLKTAGKLRYWRGTIEIPESELHAICDEIQAEHDQAVAATLGRGTLTAEQVRDVIERHSMWVNGNNRCFHNGAYEDIADELNAELGSSILYGREQIEALEAKWKAEDGTCEVRDD